MRRRPENAALGLSQPARLLSVFLAAACQSSSNAMHRRIAAVVSLIGYVAVVGCGTPWDHYRPIGHQDMSLECSPGDDQIVFNATGSGGRDLYVLRLDRPRVTRIAESPEYEVCPSFSPDGQAITYAAGQSGDRADHIFVRSVLGGPPRQLTHATGNDASPRFSPDGTLIVFDRDKTYIWGGLAANWDPGGVICVVRKDGTNERQLTPDDVFAFNPSFAADGKSVIFSTHDGLASVPTDGSKKMRKINSIPGATVSPDGKLIAYTKGRFSPDQKLFVANIDGSSERPVAPTVAACYRPVFNWAGDQLYFLREEWPDGGTGVPKFSLWETAIDGTKTRMIADRGIFDDPLNWIP